MIIYRNYTTTDVMYDLPCDINNCGKIYPIKVKDYIKFLKGYNLYFTYTPKYLKAIIPDEITKGSLQKTIILGYTIKSKTNNEFEKKNNNKEEICAEIINELTEIFEIITRTKITLDSNTGEFKGKDVVINDKNFDYVKKVVALSNLIYQPNYYDDAEFAEVMNRAREAHNKDSLSFEEIIAYVKNASKLTYEDIMNENVFQLNCDYRCNSAFEDYRTAMNFRCVSDEKSLRKVKLSPSFINSFYADSDKNLLTSLETLGFSSDND